MTEYEYRLKPCPFCGGEAQIFHTPDIIAMEETGYQAMCKECGAALPEAEMPIIAQEDWNTRADLHPSGKWQRYDDPDANAWECSLCGEVWQLMEGTPGENHMNYCHNCGAKMSTESDSHE